jgi:hypothetical protein
MQGLEKSVRVTSCLLLLLITFPTLPQAQTSKNIAVPSPVWRFDLRSVGYSGYEPAKEESGFVCEANPLTFADESVLIATFLTREKTTALARRDRLSDESPLRLNGVFLDANHGTARATKQLPVTNAGSGIIAVGDGRFLVLAPSALSLYSPDLQVLKKLGFSAVEQLVNLPND